MVMVYVLLSDIDPSTGLVRLLTPLFQIFDVQLAELQHLAERLRAGETVLLAIAEGEDAEIGEFVAGEARRLGARGARVVPEQETGTHVLQLSVRRREDLPDPDRLYNDVCAAVEAAPASVGRFEAFWDGDSLGWPLWLVARSADPEGPLLGSWRLVGASGDLRLFNGRVPPWPEAALAEGVGRQLSVRYGVPFTFDRADGLVGA